MSTSNRKIANRVLWTAQVFVALLFLFAGTMKFILPPEQMQQGSIILPIAFIRFIGVCETFGALGLLLPGIFRIKTSLTPVAAVGLTVIMVGATVLSVLGLGAAAGILPAVVGIITMSIVYGRTRIAPLSDAPRRVARFA